MNIEKTTPKLFYNQFPYKIVLKRGLNTVKRIEKDLIKSRMPWRRVKVWGEPVDRWYLSSQQQRDWLVTEYYKFVLEMSSPHSEGHLQAMIEGDNSIVRDRKFFSTYKYAIKFKLNAGWEANGKNANWLLRELCSQGLHPGLDYEMRRRVHLILYTNSDNLVMTLKLKYSESILNLVIVRQLSDF